MNLENKFEVLKIRWFTSLLQTDNKSYKRQKM